MPPGPHEDGIIIDYLELVFSYYHRPIEGVSFLRYCSALGLEGGMQVLIFFCLLFTLFLNAKRLIKNKDLEKIPTSLKLIKGLGQISLFLGIFFSFTYVYLAIDIIRRSSGTNEFDFYQKIGFVQNLMMPIFLGLINIIFSIIQVCTLDYLYHSKKTL
jgi:hypothetical protein